MLPSGTVTFLFTDIEDSTRLWERHPDAMRAALIRHDAILRENIEAHGGYVFGTAGDAFCAAFSAAPPALAAALAGQRALTAEPWDDARIRVRMAVHAGATEERDGDYFGPTLNRTARLLAAGHGGQILLSGFGYELASGQLPPGVEVRDLGERRLRDLTRPERIYQLVAAILPADFPPLRTLDAPPTNLPSQLSSFIGREEEIADLERRLSMTRLVTLTGSGGVGKTRLALHVAAALLDTYADGAWFVELGPLADPSLVPQTVAVAIDVRDSAGRSPTAALTDHLRDRHVLLVLDNCEHLIEACAALADSILRACSKVSVLATSREALGISGEAVFAVPPLSFPSVEALPVEEVSRFEAVRLFTERAQTALPGFSVTSENARAVAQVCRRLDGSPLAIELAAARVKILSVAEIADRLEDSLRLLTGGSRAAPPRQQTLRATIEWSHDLLSETERIFVRRLSVFAGGWALEAAEAVCADAALPGSDGLDLLTRLVDKSLAVADRGPGERVRYRMLETVRQHAHDRLREAGEEDVLRARHLAYFLDLAEEAGPALEGPQQVAWLDRLEEEHDNFRAALQFSLDAHQYESAARLSAALSRFWWVRGYMREGERWLTRALTESEAQGSVPPPVRWKALRAALMLVLNLADHPRATTLAQEALALARALGDREGIARGLGDLAILAKREGDVAQATVYYEESLATLDDGAPKATILYNLALLMCVQKEYQRAEALLRHALAICDAAADTMRAGWMYRALGIVALDRGEHEAAAGHLHRSLSLLWQIGEKLGIAEAFELLATIALDRARDRDHTRRAACLLAAAEVLREAIGAPAEDPAERARCIAKIRNRLPEDEVTSTWAQGRAMTLEKAVEFALQTP